MQPAINKCMIMRRFCNPVHLFTILVISNGRLLVLLLSHIHKNIDRIVDLCLFEKQKNVLKQ